MSRTTVYYWYKKTSPRKLQKLVLNTEDLNKNGELIGVFAGDGNYYVDNDYRHQIRIFINAKDSGYVEYLSNLISFVCGHKPWINIRLKENVTVLRIISKELYKFLRLHLDWTETKTRTVHLRDFKSENRPFIIGFLRGLIDTDGYINMKNKNLTFTTISEALAKDIELGLASLEIKYTCRKQIDMRPGRKPVFRIRVSADFKKFISIIKPYHVSYA